MNYYLFAHSENGQNIFILLVLYLNTSLAIETNGTCFYLHRGRDVFTGAALLTRPSFCLFVINIMKLQVDFDEIFQKMFKIGRGTSG